MKKLKDHIKQFMDKFSEVNGSLLGAAQAYYYLLSIMPLFVLLFAIIPYLNINPDDVMGFIEQAIPGEMAGVFEDNILDFVETPRGGLLTVGIIGVIWSASNAMNALIKSVNEAYNVEETRSFIHVRLLAIGLTLGMIISLVFAMVLPVFGGEMIEFLESHLGFSNLFTTIFDSLRWIIGFLLLTLFLVVLFRYTPSVTLPFKHTFPGALVASVLWQVTSFGFSFYISNFGNYDAVYGSLGSIIILMIWFYLTGTILIVGAIINVLIHENNRTDIHTEQNHNMSS